MLQSFLPRLCEELSIFPIPEPNKNREILFHLGEGLEARLAPLEPGLAVTAFIAPCPERKREELFTFLMRANLLGQGTGGCRIGLDPQEKLLTLSLGLPYELTYQTFRETLENFFNYLVYWQEEVAKFEQTAL